jgi:hypothetical protein
VVSTARPDLSGVGFGTAQYSTTYNLTTGTYDWIDISFQTTNTGGSSTGGNSPYRLRFDRGNNGYDETQTGTIGDLAAGAPSGFQTKRFLNVPFGANQVTVDVDYPDTITESNEGDNSATYTFGGSIPPPNPGLDIKSDRQQVRSGETANITWNITARYPMNCRVYGPNFGPFTFDPSTLPPLPRTETTPGITAKSEYVATCTEPVTNTTFTDTVIVETIGTIEEV